MKGTALLSQRNSLDGELWPAAQKVGCGQQLWGHPNTVSLMSGTGPTPQAQLPSPLRGWPSEGELSSQPSFLHSASPNSYLSQGGGRASWDLSPSPSRSSRYSSHIIPGMVAVTRTERASPGTSGLLSTVTLACPGQAKSGP